MKLKNRAEVFTQDGKKAGHIERVVMNPLNLEVTHIVVERGFLFTEEKVVPIDMIGTATEERVTLRLNVDEVGKLHNLIETHFIPADTTQAYQDSFEPETPHPIFWYPPAGTMWWTPGAYPSSAVPPFVTRSTVQLPEETVALKEGAHVISQDGKHIGNVEQVLTDAEAGRVTHLLISEGFFLKEKKLVPTLWVKEVGENEVYLSIDSDLFEQIPDYKPAS